MKTELTKIAQDLEQGTITDQEARNLLLGLLGVSGSFIVGELEWLAENACMDFLGTDSNSEAAEREEKKWWAKLDNLINVVKNYC
jgi:hypothetical protein